MTVVVMSTTGERSELLETVTLASAEVSHQWVSAPENSSPVEPVVTVALTLLNWASVAATSLPAGAIGDDVQPITPTENTTVKTSTVNRLQREHLICAPHTRSADSAAHSRRRDR